MPSLRVEAGTGVIWRFSEDLDFDWIHADASKQAIHDFFS